MQPQKNKYISKLLKAKEVKKFKLTNTFRKLTVKQFLILTTGTR